MKMMTISTLKGANGGNYRSVFSAGEGVRVVESSRESGKNC